VLERFPGAPGAVLESVQHFVALAELVALLHQAWRMSASVSVKEVRAFSLGPSRVSGSAPLLNFPMARKSTPNFQAIEHAVQVNHLRGDADGSRRLRLG